MRKTIALIVGMGLCVNQVTAAPSVGALGGLDAKLEKDRVEEAIPGLAVAIASHGKIIYEKGFGWANRERREPVSEHTIFSLASISKPMTTTGLMTLVQAGMVDLDRPANDYLGDAKLQARVGDASQATVRRVANHSSGLPVNYQYFFADEPDQPPSRDELIVRHGNLITTPGERYQYSNVGFAVLDYIISRVSGQDYADFMRQEVFVKLGLTHTSVGIGPGLEKFVATRYGDDGAPLPFYVTETPGSSAVYSSAHDLVRFGMFHLKDHLPDQQAILRDASLDELHRPTQQEGGEPPAGYAIGWEAIDRPDGYHIVTHTGGMPGVATTLILVPGEDLAVVMLANGGPIELTEVERLVMTAVLPRWKPTPRQPEKKPPSLLPRHELVGTWVGHVHTYAGDRPLRMQFQADGLVLFQVGDQTASTVSEVEIEKGSLTGVARGELNVPELRRHGSYALELNLQLRADELTGGVTATRHQDRPFGLTYWTELHKQP
jgi:CubicO group peptidase (beta-lactamase class C family)